MRRTGLAAAMIAMLLAACSGKAPAAQPSRSPSPTPSSSPSPNPCPTPPLELFVTLQVASNDMQAVATASGKGDIATAIAKEREAATATETASQEIAPFVPPAGVLLRQASDVFTRAADSMEQGDYGTAVTQIREGTAFLTDATTAINNAPRPTC